MTLLNETELESALIATAKDLGERNAELRAVLVKADKAFADLTPHGYHPMRVEIQTVLAQTK